jgi:hypothetical protein
MDQSKRFELERKLREMLRTDEEAQSEQNRPRIRSGKGNIIRRRKGEREKRIAN